MELDAMKYRNSFGDEVNLMSATVRSNPREAKIWSYGTTDAGVVIQPKPFSLTIICSSDASHKGTYYANEVIDKLSRDANYNAVGYLEINSWRLDCSFIGVANIETDLWGVVKFTANFYAPQGFLWYKINANRVTLPASGNIGQLAQFTSNNNIVATKIIIKPHDNINDGYIHAAELNANISKNMSGYNRSSFYHNFNPSSSSNFDKFYCVDSFRKQILIATQTSTTVELSDGDYRIKNTSDGMSFVNLLSSAYFYFFPFGQKPKISADNNQFRYSSYAYITFYELRGMPEWTTT